MNMGMVTSMPTGMGTIIRLTPAPLHPHTCITTVAPINTTTAHTTNPCCW